MSMDIVDEVKIQNVSNWLKSLRLNSGTVLHIPPHATSEAIASVEVQDNTEVDKLLQQCSICVHEITASTPEAESNTNTERGLTPSTGE
jgi:hypothetical protein